MSLPKSSTRSGGLSFWFGFAITGCTLIPLLLFAAPPAWWFHHTIVNPDATANDYAPANQGQLKNIAQAAAAEMDAQLPGGAGDAIHASISDWSVPIEQTNDFAPANLGQLKNMAKPFYDRLFTVGLAIHYPWNDSLNTTDDFAVCNIGQVKNIFSFPIDLLYDGDHNGLPDAWETKYFGRPGVAQGDDIDRVG